MRLQLARAAPEPAGGLPALAPALLPLVATITLLSALGLALVAPWVLKSTPAGGPATTAVKPSVAAVGAMANLTPHQLYGDTLRLASFVPPSATKQPMFGVAGIVLDYQTNGKRVEVYE